MLEQDGKIITKIERNNNVIKTITDSQIRVIHRDCTAITDSVESYTKNVPASSLNLVKLLMIGGKSAVIGGDVVSAKVDKVISIGKNLAKFRPDLNTDAQYFNYTSNQDNAIVATRTATSGKFYAVFKAKVENGKNYSFVALPGANVQVFLYTDRIWGTLLEQFTIISSGGMVHRYTATYTGDLIIALYGSTNEISVYDFMLKRLDASNEYKHYIEHEYPIPSEVQALDGYGESNGTKVNYIDYSAKKFIAYGHYVNGEWVDYAEPIQNDISEYLTDSKINVEGGGSLVFHQTDNTEFVVPNSEKFFVAT